MTTQDRITQSVRILMAITGTTQADLAGACGLSQQAISRRMRGTTPWDATNLDSLADRLGVNIVDLLGMTVSAAWEQRSVGDVASLVPTLTAVTSGTNRHSGGGVTVEKQSTSALGTRGVTVEKPCLAAAA